MSERFETKRCIKSLYKYSSFPVPCVLSFSAKVWNVFMGHLVYCICGTVVKCDLVPVVSCISEYIFTLVCVFFT